VQTDTPDSYLESFVCNYTQFVIRVFVGKEKIGCEGYPQSSHHAFASLGARSFSNYTHASYPLFSIRTGFTSIMCF